MTVQGLRDWLRGNELSDELYLMTDGVVEEGVYTVEKINEKAASADVGECFVIHVSAAGISPLPWILINPVVNNVPYSIVDTAGEAAPPFFTLGRLLLWGIGGLGVALIISLIVFCVFSPGGNSAEREASEKEATIQNRRETACLMARRYVKDNLKSPISAQFPLVASFKCEQMDDAGEYEERFIVRSYVDSQNGFGAMIRSIFVVIVGRISDDEWELVDIAFE